jgi:U2-associated protein SR140
MAFKFSLGTTKATKAQLNAKARAEDEKKVRQEQDALAKVVAGFEEEHGVEKSILGDAEREEPEVFVPTGSKRHFTGRLRTTKSGPGTLDPGPLDGYGRPEPSAGRLAAQMQSRFGGAVPTGPAAMEGPKQTENMFVIYVAKASNLPPTIDPRRVEELFTEFSSLKVENIRPGPSATGRPSATMIVTFDKAATRVDFDKAILKLNDKKYLGKGYYLHIDRYYGNSAVDTAQHTEPYGARWQVVEKSKLFAPSAELGGSGGGGKGRSREDTEQLIVTANRPPDAATLRLVHQTIEGVILGGVEFEAALMNEPRIQDDERFAWLYDQKHPVNRYYRWRLHRIVSNSSNSEIFAGQAIWKGPEVPLADEFANHLGTLNPDNRSHESDNSDSDEKEKPQSNLLPVGDDYPGRVDTKHGTMSPRSRAMLLWMLTSLPPRDISADDVAAISNFAIAHVGQGLDEVISILVSNIIQPFQLTDANARNTMGDAEGKDVSRRPDLRILTVNALRIISDLILVTAVVDSGVSYKDRGVIERQLIDRKVFEHLEQLPAQLGMSFSNVPKYRGEVNAVLEVWREEHALAQANFDHLDEVFNARENQKAEEVRVRRQMEQRKRKGKVVLKTPTATEADQDGDEKMDVDEKDEEDVSTPEAPSPAEEAVEEAAASTPPQDVLKVPAQSTEPEIPGETAAARARRLRPKAEDMFASDEE